jgi:ABC-type multidrug transport system fused ATPase/permease subunit
MDEVIAAAKAANIHDDIMALEEGYETVLGRRKDARGVSVGQKQRICIAASLLKNAPILFLDEATSNLDSVSERVVQAAFERLMAGRTSFIIAHRLSTLRSADRILVLEAGRVVGLGPHATLLQQCPTYRRLWTTQMQGDTPVADVGLPVAVRRVSG